MQAVFGGIHYYVQIKADMLEFGWSCPDFKYGFLSAHLEAGQIFADFLQPVRFADIVGDEKKCSVVHEVIMRKSTMKKRCGKIVSIKDAG
ncbi:MAG: hypothetical protein Q8O31_08620 [Rhodocyclaceae bacterium]|nr:hypothetical protein [Rhodocyclaceae bacterium]